MSRVRIITFAVALGLAIPPLLRPVAAQAATSDPLLEIYILKYAGQADVIDKFRMIIEEKIKIVKDTLSTGNAAAYLKKLKVNSEHGDERCQ